MISAKKWHSILGCVNRDRARRSRQELFSLSSGLIRWHLVTNYSFGHPQYNKHIDNMTGVEGSPLRLWGQSPSTVRRGCGTGAVSVRRSDDFRSSEQHPHHWWEGWRRHSWTLHSCVWWESKGQWHKLKHEWLRLEIREAISSWGKANAGARASWGWTISITGGFMLWLNKALCTLVWAHGQACSRQGLGMETSPGPC